VKLAKLFSTENSKIVKFQQPLPGKDFPIACGWDEGRKKEQPGGLLLKNAL
jgi:hypothetical protein